MTDTIIFHGEDKIALNGGRAFPKGSKPGAITYQYLDGDGNPIDTSTGVWTVQPRVEGLYGADASGMGDGATGFVAGDGSDPSHSIATYTWDSDDFNTVGKFKMVIWVGNGTERFGSATFHWEVSENPGTDPTV